MNPRDRYSFRSTPVPTRPIEVEPAKKMKISLELTNEETDLLRKNLSSLGTNKTAIGLQLKVANAILDAI